MRVSSPRQLPGLNIYKNGTGKHINNFGLGQFDRHRTNVWTYAGLNVLKSGREEELALHPTVKPVELLADALKDCSRRNGIVLDPFGGSGSLLIAAEITQRSARVIEIDPKYVDVAIKRWQKTTNEAAVLESTGQTFDQVTKERDL